MIIDRTEINDIVKELSKVIKSEVKKGVSFDDMIHDDKVKEVFKNHTIDVDFSGTGDRDYTTYGCTLGAFNGRVTRKNLNQHDVEGFGCTKIDVKDAFLDVCIEYGEKNKIEIVLSCEVDWQDRYGNWHSEYPCLKTWVVMESMYDDVMIDEKYIECKAWVHDDFENRLVILRPSTYKESFRTPQNLIVRATGGFGTRSDTIGRAVYYTCPYDGENAGTDRNNVEYVIKEEYEEEVLKKYCAKEEVI